MPSVVRSDDSFTFSTTVVTPSPLRWATGVAPLLVLSKLTTAAFPARDCNDSTEDLDTTRPTGGWTGTFAGATEAPCSRSEPGTRAVLPSRAAGGACCFPLVTTTTIP